MEERAPNAADQDRIVAAGIRDHVQCPMAANSSRLRRSAPAYQLPEIRTNLINDE
jgi:hypothetical protein